MADSKQVRDGFLTAAEGGGHIKNLYLRDKDRYLVVLQEDADLDLKWVAKRLGPSLVFWFNDRLLECLGVRPGAVRPGYGSVVGTSAALNPGCQLVTRAYYTAASAGK